MLKTTQQIARNENGQVDTYAWPGGYPLFYLVEDGEVLCPKCVNENLGNESFEPIALDVNYEDQNLFCCHCNTRIESAYE